MAFVTLALVLGALMGPPLATLLLGVWLQRLNDRNALPRYARITAYTLLGVSVLVTFGVATGLFNTYAAVRTAGWSAAQKQSILANGIAESFYNGLFGALVVVACATWLAVFAWREGRRR